MVYFLAEGFSGQKASFQIVPFFGSKVPSCFDAVYFCYAFVFASEMSFPGKKVCIFAKKRGFL